MAYDIPGLGSSPNARVMLARPYLRGIVETVSGTITKVLPPAADSFGQFITYKKTDANTTTVTVDGYGSETIDGQTTITITEQYEVVRLYSDGTSWHIV